MNMSRHSGLTAYSRDWWDPKLERMRTSSIRDQSAQELVSGSVVGSSEVGLSLPTIAVLETWTVANWQNGKWLGNYYLLMPFCNFPVWTVGTWNYEARTNG
nr:hypothetical protein Iba_chr04fCG5750 [Ipomoea batatas]